ncbi:MAG: cell division protein FtsQ/DivIB [Fluviicola sp.]
MRSWVKIASWSVLGVLVIALLVITQRAQKNIPTDEPQIEVHVAGEAHFITEDEILNELDFHRLWKKGMRSGDIPIEKIEAYLKGISQVKDARVYQKLGGEWKIEVTTRNPIARIFNKQGETYYLDDEGVKMETSELHAARILVVTGEIPDRFEGQNISEIINNDSLKSIQKLDDIYRISSYVCDDPLFHSLIGQIHLEKNGDFVLIPLVGDQKVVFGSALTEEEVAEKFKKLKIFYKEAMPYEGWNTYTEISLKYEDQIVCKKKETDG